MSEEAQAPAGGGFEVEPEDVKSSKSDTPKTESKESKSQPKSETKSSDGNSESKQEAKDAGPAPWANDLAERGLDDPRIDQYLREVWQPRMTQFEQDLAGWSELFGGDMEAAQIMAGLAEALDNDPEGTYQQMGELLGLSGDIWSTTSLTRQSTVPHRMTMTTKRGTRTPKRGMSTATG